jgi:hypothetical protein
MSISLKVHPISIEKVFPKDDGYLFRLPIQKNQNFTLLTTLPDIINILVNQY